MYPIERLPWRRQPWCRASFRLIWACRPRKICLRFTRPRQLRLRSVCRSGPALPASVLFSGLERAAGYNSCMQVWLGTSGYSYPDWVGGFYPPGTRSNQMLNRYAESFPLVELNFTFYRLPTPAMLARLANQAPDGFQFVVKMPRSLSHEES